MSFSLQKIKRAKGLSSIPSLPLNPSLYFALSTEEMGGSRRKYKRSKPKVRVGLPKKNPNIFKPAFTLPPKLRSLVNSHWDDKGSVIDNYKSFGVVSNPNLLGVRCRTSHMIETDSLQVPPPQQPPPSDDATDAFEALDDSGSEVEEDGQSAF